LGHSRVDFLSDMEPQRTTRSRTVPERRADPFLYNDEHLPFEVRPSFWGYVIRSTEGAPILFQITQGLVLALGAGFGTSAVVLLIAPANQGVSIFHLGLALLLVATSLLLLRFATRGTVVELQIDLARGELREIVRHRVGRPTLLGRHNFDPSASLHINRSGPVEGMPSLVLHHRGSDEGLCIARGPERVLQELRIRLAHDLRVHAPEGRLRRA
jgi:hypothetical protein